MAAVITDLLRQYEEAKPYADPATRNWFLLNDTPVYVWVVTLIYLGIVLLGPGFMRNRKPWNVPPWFIVVYNLSCVYMSLYMTVEIVITLIQNRYDLVCAPYTEESRSDPKEYRMKCVLYWYFFSKSIELIDTLLMVVRKKNSQITFLHVFHHVSMLNIWWWVMMFIPCGSSYFGALMNSLVHVVMYSYYGLSAIPSLRNKLWWKKYITRFQLMQFIVTGTHSALVWYLPCDFPKWGPILLTGYMVVLFVLFMNFYIKSYLTKRPRAAGDDAKRHAKASHKNGSTVVTNGQSSSNGAVAQNGVLVGEANGHITANGDTVSDKKSN